MQLSGIRCRAVFVGVVVVVVGALVVVVVVVVAVVFLVAGAVEPLHDLQQFLAR